MNVLPVGKSMGFGALIVASLLASGCSMNEWSAKPKVYTIELPAPTAQEAASLRNTSKDRPHPVGYGRELPSAQQRIELRQLNWQRHSADGYIAALAVRSPGAKSLRVGLQLRNPANDLRVAFQGAHDTAVPAAVIVAIAPDVYWSPVIPGDVVHIELWSMAIPQGDAALHIPRVSHIP